jgi:lysophospholipase L1-like esterase
MYSARHSPAASSNHPSRRDVLVGAATVGGLAAVGSLVGSFAGPADALTAPPRGTNDIGSIGDSLSHNGVGRGMTGETGNGMAVFGVESFIGWALLQSPARFRFHGTWATGGYDTRHIRYVHLPAALRSNAALVSLIGGTNDIRLNTPLDVTQQNIDYMVGKLLANAQLPILGTVPPYDVGTADQKQQILALNAWLVQYAASKSVPIVDYHSAVADPATGTYRTGYDVDGIHPSSTGAFAMGRALADTLGTLPGGVAPPLLHHYTPSALLADATLVGPPAGETPTWTVLGTASGGTLVPTPGNWSGNMGIATRGSSNLYAVGKLAPLIPAHTISISFVLSTNPAPPNGAWSILLYDAKTKKTICGYSNLDQAIGYGTCQWEFVLPNSISRTHQYELVYAAQNTPGTTIGLAEVSVLDLTALGLVPARR